MDYHIIYISEGTLFLREKGEEIAVNKGNIILYLPDEPQDYYCKTGFDATPLLIYGYLAFNIVSVAVLLVLDCIRYFALKDACLTTVFDKMKPWQRWLCYYGLIALIMAGFIMNNGGYGASASFIYNNY